MTDRDKHEPNDGGCALSVQGGGGLIRGITGAQQVLSDEPSLRESPTPWLYEPDEYRFADAETGYECLIRRHLAGSLCGYVAVPVAHPAHGFSGSTSLYEIEEVLSGEAARKAPVQAVLNEIRVHGGITYSDDRSPVQTESDGRWWFGFDCAHAGDFSPKYDPPERLGSPTGWGSVYTYRTLDYVKAECAALALQLQAMASPSARKDGSSL